MAAPGCYITSFHRNFDNELPVDAEQALPGIAAAGIEMADFLIARAPSPCLVLGRGNDFFDPRGTKEAVAETGSIYELLGGRDHLAFHVEPGDHGYGPGNRRRCTGFSWMRPESRGRSKSCRPGRSFSLRRTGQSTGSGQPDVAGTFSPHGAASRSGSRGRFRVP